MLILFILLKSPAIGVTINTHDISHSVFELNLKAPSASKFKASGFLYCPRNSVCSTLSQEAR